MVVARKRMAQMYQRRFLMTLAADAGALSAPPAMLMAMSPWPSSYGSYLRRRSAVSPCGLGKARFRGVSQLAPTVGEFAIDAGEVLAHGGARAASVAVLDGGVHRPMIAQNGL